MADHPLYSIKVIERRTNSVVMTPDGPPLNKKYATKALKAIEEHPEFDKDRFRVELCRVN